MQKYANKICKNMQNICKNIRVYVFAYGAYICTPHFADAECAGARRRVASALPAGDSARERASMRSTRDHARESRVRALTESTRVT
jgi:hypothetical protein